MTVHRLSTTDTLPILAARYFGDASRWREIALANDLRPPYVSADPLAQYGELLASYPLPAPLVAGVVSWSQAGMDVAFLRAGARVVLEQTTASGMSWRDAATVVGYDSDAITISAPLSYSYAAGVSLNVYNAASALHGTVAAPGDQLLILDTQTDQDQEVTVADRFGCDLAVDAGGRLLLNTEGDLSLISGKENLIQQLRNRLRCERNAMPRHPDYGCSAQSYIGAASGPALSVLLQSALALSLSDDPRIGSVESVGVTIENDLVDVAARVIAKNEAVDLALVVGR